jgi:hypothetical protein
LFIRTTAMPKSTVDRNRRCARLAIEAALESVRFIPNSAPLLETLKGAVAALDDLERAPDACAKVFDLDRWRDFSRQCNAPRSIA